MSDNTEQFRKNEEELPKQWTSTKEGRVVYSREKHIFTSSDFVRIAVKTNLRWEEEIDQWIVKDRIYLVLELCRRYLFRYYEGKKQADVYSNLIATLQSLTELMIEEILRFTGVPLPVSIAMSSKVYDILYTAVYSIVGLFIKGEE